MRAHYTDRELVRFIIRDLVTEIRCAVRDGLHTYAEEQRTELRRILKTRHAPTIDRLGWVVK